MSTADFSIGPRPMERLLRVEDGRVQADGTILFSSPTASRPDDMQWKSCKLLMQMTAHKSLMKASPNWGVVLEHFSRMSLCLAKTSMSRTETFKKGNSRRQKIVV